MSLADALRGLADLMAESPVLLLAVVLAIGSAAGAVRIRGFSLGPAAVLFAALGVSALDPRLVLPADLGLLGLALFAYCVGVQAGPGFFGGLRTGRRAMAGVLVAIAAGAAVAIAGGRALGIPSGMQAGVFAGALTNTPALAAAAEALGSQQPTVGYSVTYVGGVLGMGVAATLALRTSGPATRSEAESQVPVELTQGTVRIDRADHRDLGRLGGDYSVAFGRIMRGDRPGHPGTVDIAVDTAVTEPGDIVTVIGSGAAVDAFTAELGHPSTVPLTLDRRRLDYQSVTVSRPELTGLTLGELRLTRRFGVTATRVARSDVEILAADDLAVMIGDRLRVVGTRASIQDVRRFLGDSERRASTFDPLGLSVGLAIGLLLGLVEVPLPGGGSFALGTAGGPLLVGLVLGRVQRSGRVVWALPYGAASALSGLGMVVFLAYAGCTSGPALADTIATPIGPRLLALGLAVTAMTALLLLLLGRYLGRASGPRLAGMVAGAQTQPAVLAFADSRTGHDPAVSIGYALVYPVAMIAKVVLAPWIGSL